jgi:DNA-binding NtrC family response regulator
MVNKKPGVLIVDDEPVVCDLLHSELSERGYQCTAVLSGKDALAQLASQDFDAVLLDIRLPGMSGMDVLREIWLNHNTTATIMITAVNDVDTAVEAMKLGASDYIVKPFDLDRVDTSIRTALETKPTAETAPSDMDAIARGVEARLDPLSSYSEMVTRRTIDIAWQLGIPEEEIQRWAVAKAGLDAKVARLIKSD